MSAALADGDATRDAPFESSAYARFAAVKALMPHAAAALRAPALTQDADVVRGPGPPKRDSGYRRERRTRRGTETSEVDSADFWTNRSELSCRNCTINIILKSG